MSELLSRLWCGELCPVRSCGQESEELEQLEALAARNLTRAKSGLSEEQMHWLERYGDALAEHRALLAEQAFCDGLRLGMQLAAQAFL
ncbi:MAG: hypothetical protein IIV78_03140 [Oscillospiraceae bacterium]|nr:hypothetical protein [Oscillospiraceae bacterium]